MPTMKTTITATMGAVIAQAATMRRLARSISCTEASSPPATAL